MHHLFMLSSCITISNTRNIKLHILCAFFSEAYNTLEVTPNCLLQACELLHVVSCALVVLLRIAKILL